MKKRLIAWMCLCLLFGCAQEAEKEEEIIIINKVNGEIINANVELREAIDPNAPPEGMYFSELTGEPISLSLIDQRPIAVMVDNEILAYPHYGLAEADVVYEMVNSTHNNRISRLMVLVKDWEAIEMLGSIRSTRDTNIDLQAEWNSILCHDGASAISLPRFSKGYALEHISGTFSRVQNGKAIEFTEFILQGDVLNNINNFGFSRNYNEYKPNVETHFQFLEYSSEAEVLDSDEYMVANNIYLSAAFPHNLTELHYNAETKSYDYYNYGAISIDGEDNEVQSYKNVILQDIIMFSTDNAGHVGYQLVDSGRGGYYISNGHAQRITWTKNDEMDITRYYDENGNELIINRGNTYIALVPAEVWEAIGID